MIVLATTILLLIVYLAGNKRYRWFYILYKTLPRDLTAAKRFFELNWAMSKWERHNDTVPKMFCKLVKQHPNKVAFCCEGQKWTYLEVNKRFGSNRIITRTIQCVQDKDSLHSAWGSWHPLEKQLEEFSNQIAHYFKSQGYRKGDSVALLLENRPEYVGIWIGLAKIGVVTALINTNLVHDPLVHSITVAHSKALIYGSDFKTAVAEISDKIKDLSLFVFGNKDEVMNGSINLSKEMINLPKTLPKEVHEGTPHDKIIYIYTSGTTGLPKAAVIANTRFMYAAAGIKCLAQFTEDDIYYSPLPLYHSAGGMLAVGMSLIYGCTVVIRKKFSASNYWSDCQKYNCTVANYIGEICRYLLAVHKPGTEVKHSVKKIIGNGLRPQIWDTFRSTFHIEHVYEFYGSTEGNSNLINIDNTPGAVGFLPRYANFLYSVMLVQCDEHTGEPIRNKEGLCNLCAPNEAGVLIGKINPKRASSDFAGYADESATKKKVLKDVFRKGDVYFNSGDVLVQDELGYYFFKDRTGDTFRWKGENVATSEVEAVISNVAELHDAVVYGVQIPDTEGRAGMAAIVDPDNTLDLKKLATGLKAKLPAYAIPIFIRIMDAIPMTGTFKMKKVDLLKEGFDIDKIKDHRLFYYNAKNIEYVPLTKDVYNDILQARLKL